MCHKSMDDGFSQTQHAHITSTHIKKQSITHGGGAVGEGPSCESLGDITHSGPSIQGLGLSLMETELDQHPRLPPELWGHRGAQRGRS